MEMSKFCGSCNEKESLAALDLPETVWGLDEYIYCVPEISVSGFLSKGVDSTMLVVGLPYGRRLSIRASNSATDETITFSKKASPPVK